MYVICDFPNLERTYQSSWWLLVLHGKHFETQKDKGQQKIAYPSIPSSIAPANHGPKLSIPQPPTMHAISSTSSKDDDADFEVDT